MGFSPMSGVDRFDLLLSLVEELVRANEATPILVEGQRDVRALRGLGCRGLVRPLHNGQRLFGVAEDLARHQGRVILLTDWDRKGDQLGDVLEGHLQACGVQADVSFRTRLKDLVGTQLKDVESLLPHVRRGLAHFHRRTLEEHARARFGIEALLASRAGPHRAHG